MTRLENLVNRLAELSPVLVLEKHDGGLKRIGRHQKVVTTGDVIALLRGAITQDVLFVAEKILGASMYREDEGLWYGVRRETKPAPEAL